MLPKLPKKIKHKESDFGTEFFRPWVEKNAEHLISSTFELKQTEEYSIPFSCVEDLQVDASLSVKYSKKGYLIRVQSGTIAAPDYSFHKNDPAYIVIKYASRGIVIIDIDTWNLEKSRSKRKSLTFDRAVAIAWRVIHTKERLPKK